MLSLKGLDLASPRGGAFCEDPAVRRPENPEVRKRMLTGGGSHIQAWGMDEAKGLEA